MENAGYLLAGPHQPGAEQMELDRNMAAATTRDRRVRVRFYRFDPPCLSLGHHQSHLDVDEVACHERGFTLAVRPTGGRAVLHKGDFVYSVTVASDGQALEAGLHTGVYNLVSLALATGLRRIGIEPDGASRHLDVSPAVDLPKLCFSSATRHEITVGGKKLVGSAQRILRGSVLQHGSLLVTDEHLELTDLLAGLSEERRNATRRALEMRTTNLEAEGWRGTFEEMAEAFSASFGEAFGGLERVDEKGFLAKG